MGRADYLQSLVHLSRLHPKIILPWSWPPITFLVIVRDLLTGAFSTPEATVEPRMKRIPAHPALDPTTTSTSLKKNLNASKPSEHPPDRRENVKTLRWEYRLQRQNLLMAFNRVPRW